MKLLNLFLQYKEYYIEGAKITLQLSAISLIMGIGLGSILSLLKLSKSKLLSGFSSIYIELVRGTPMMVQIAIVYYGSFVLTGINISAFIASVIAVSLNSAAYVAEIFRSGIQSIDKGQWEAAKSLGLTEGQTMKHIIMPQAIKNILPALGNEFVTLIKETSVASTIGVTDLMFNSNIVLSTSYVPFYPLLIVGIIYFILTYSLSQLVRLLEKKLSHSQAKEVKGAKNKTLVGGAK